tara:strand:- start:678 stop:4919 length:4242 start_codon:yes stop_codon:yes gene_type:complete
VVYVCNPCNTYQLQPEPAQTECFACDDGPVDCDFQSVIMVEKGYWRPENFPLNRSLGEAIGSQAVICPWADACLGGDVWGNESCIFGHHGILCGECLAPDYYRCNDACCKCPNSAGTTGAMVSAAWITGGTFILIGLAGFLFLAGRSSGKTGDAQGGGLAAKFPKLARVLARLPPRWRQQLAAAGKIVVAFTQCISPLREFNRVVWPETFTNFMDSIDVGDKTAATVKLDSAVPAECFFGFRLGFYYELVATMLLPVISFVVILIVASIVFGVEYHRNKREYREKKGAYDRFLAKNLAADLEQNPPPQPPPPFSEMLNRPQVWTLNIWSFLLLYPVVTRKLCKTFMCMTVDGVRVLKDDPVIHCDLESAYLFFSMLAVGGLFVMCVVMPLALVRITTRSHRSGSRIAQERVSLLTQSYDDKYHYWEAIELTRKFLLTSVVLFVYPESPVQLWFVDVVGLIFLILYLGAAPYRDQSSSRLQVVALVQLEFTYITATLFYDREHVDETVGVGLVAANCVMACLLVLTVGRSVGGITTQLGELELTFVDDGSLVLLKPPQSNLELDTHLFMSHMWRHAEDQVNNLKSLLFTMLPTCSIRVVMDAEDAAAKKQLEEQVDRSSVFLAFLTIEYIGSPQCRRELTAAYKANKPLIVVREADARFGGLCASAFRAEVALFVARNSKILSEDESAAIKWLLDSCGNALEWHREKQLKYVVLQHIAEVIYHYNLATAPKEKASRESSASMSSRDESPGVETTPERVRRSSIFDRFSSYDDSPTSERRDSMGDNDAGGGGKKRRKSMVSIVVSSTSSGIPATPEKLNVDTKTMARNELMQERRGQPMRNMRIQDALVLSEAETSATVVYLSEHYKSLPATGNALRPQQGLASAAAALLSPSEYAAAKEGSSSKDAPPTDGIPPRFTSLYHELVHSFGTLGIRVTSDGDEAYDADRRALTLLVLCPQLFQDGALVDEVAHYLRNQADPLAFEDEDGLLSHVIRSPGKQLMHAARDLGFGTAMRRLEEQDTYTHTALIDKGLSEESLTERSEERRRRQGPPTAADQLKAFEVADTVVFSMRPPLGPGSSSGPTSSETHWVTLKKTPLGFGLSIGEESNVVVAVEAGSQAARGGVLLNDLVVSVDRRPLAEGTLPTLLRDAAIGASVVLGLRSLAAREAESFGDAPDQVATYSVTLIKTTIGFGLSLDSSNVVTEIETGSQAARSGQMAVGDEVVALNGTPMVKPEDELVRAESSFGFGRRRKWGAPKPNRSFGNRSFGKGGKALAAAVYKGLRWRKRSKTIVPFFSTVQDYEEYVRVCPPDLKEHGLFQLHFDKWPETPLLQPAAAMLAIAKLPGRKAAAAETRIGLFGRFGLRFRGKREQLPAAQGAAPVRGTTAWGRLRRTPLQTLQDSSCGSSDGARIEHSV